MIDPDALRAVLSTDQDLRVQIAAIAQSIHVFSGDTDETIRKEGLRRELLRLLREDKEIRIELYRLAYEVKGG